MRTYVIGIQGSPLVKIGRTTGTSKGRLSQLQTGQPEELLLLLDLEGDYERELHLHFAQQRHRGEWFDLATDDPAALVAQTVKTLNPAPTVPSVPTQRAAVGQPQAPAPPESRSRRVCSTGNCPYLGWECGSAISPFSCRLPESEVIRREDEGAAFFSCTGHTRFCTCGGLCL